MPKTHQLNQIRRTKYYKSIKQNLKLSLVDKTKNFLLNDRYFDIDNISIRNIINYNPSDRTTSNSILLLLSGINELKDSCLIFKYSPSYNTDLETNIETEQEISIIVSKLFELRVTPHIFYHIKSIKITDIDDLNKKFKYLYPLSLSGYKYIRLDKEKSKNQKSIYSDITLFVNETDCLGNKYKLESLKNYFIQNLLTLYLDNYYILLILMFQIIYTIMSLGKIGIKHNDLHFGNILCLIPIKDDDNFEITHNFNSYKFDDNTYNIPDINYSARIFDYDLSCKLSRDDTFKQELRSEIKYINYETEYQNIFLNYYDNVNYDILKFLSYLAIYIYKIKSRNIHRTSIKNLINKFGDGDRKPLTFFDQLYSNSKRKDRLNNYSDHNFGNIKTPSAILREIYIELITIFPQYNYNSILEKNIGNLYDLNNVYEPVNTNNNLVSTFFNKNMNGGFTKKCKKSAKK